MKKFIVTLTTLLLLVIVCGCTTVSKGGHGAENLPSLKGDVPELGEKIHIIELTTETSKSGRKRYVMRWKLVDDSEVRVARSSGRFWANDFSSSPDQVYLVVRDKADDPSLYLKLLVSPELPGQGK